MDIPSVQVRSVRRRRGRRRSFSISGEVSEFSANSAGFDVTSWCSTGDAMDWNATRCVPVLSSPWPRSAVRRNCRSPCERSKIRQISSIACGAWRSRICVAAFAMIALPRSVLDHVGGVLGRHRDAGPPLAGALGHPEEELAAGRLLHQQPGFVDDDLPGFADGGIGHLPPHRIEREKCADRLELAGEVAQGEHDKVALGPCRGRTREQPGERACGERLQPRREVRPVVPSAKTSARSASSGAGRVQVRGSDVMPARW